MTTAYNLTDENIQTYGGCQWTLGRTKKTSGRGSLCGKGWLHAYTHPLLAVLLTPAHTFFNPASMRLFRAEANGKHNDDNGMDVECTEITLREEISVPVVTPDQRVAFAILCAKEVCKNDDWNKWADKWLDGTDRTRESAESARHYVARAVFGPVDAVYAATAAAVHVANATVDAARYAAKSAAYTTHYAKGRIDIVALAEEAVRLTP